MDDTRPFRDAPQLRNRSFRKGDVNPAQLPRLGSPLCTRIRAGHIGGASWTLTLSSTSSTRPQLEEAVLKGLFP
jgi:hypothetical protein